MQPGPRRGPRQMHRYRPNQLECIFACEFSKCEQSLVRTQMRMHTTHCLNEHSFQASGPASASSKHRRLAARMGDPIAFPSHSSCPSATLEGCPKPSRPRRHFGCPCAWQGCRLCNPSLLDAAGLCARRMARGLRSRKANTNCIMTDHRVLRPARLQIK